MEGSIRITEECWALRSPRARSRKLQQLWPKTVLLAEDPGGRHRYYTVKIHGETAFVSKANAAWDDTAVSGPTPLQELRPNAMAERILSDAGISIPARAAGAFSRSDSRPALTPASILLSLVLIAGLLGLFTWYIVDEVTNPGPDEGDICSSPGEVVYDDEGRALVCR